MANNYHQALIIAYEDEVGGAAYFRELTNIFTDVEKVEKLQVLVQLEKQTTDALYTLIKRHNLTTQPKEHVSNKAIFEAKQTAKGKTWDDLLKGFAHEFPPYIDEFKECLSLAPYEDRAILQQTIEHEVALVEFVEQELKNSSNSLDCINNHIEKYSS